MIKSKRSFAFVLLISFFSLVFSSLSIDAQKINGVNVVGTSKGFSALDLQPILDLGASHACFIPFAYAEEGESHLSFKNVSWQWKGESIEGVLEGVQLAHQKKLKTIIKPQVWISHGSFTGDFKLNTASEWENFESDYREYILSFARLAEQENVSIFCLGTEFCDWVQARPKFWADLITELRTVYRGKLTYASNWDSFTQFPHWDKLDFIGIDAYFPICNQTTPKLKTLLIGWQTHYNELKNTSDRYNKPILFTEYGYRSVDQCAKEPWESSRGGNVNTIAQYNSYLALFRRFWEQEWFAGGLIWKWYPNHAKAGGIEDNRFTPQNKPAEGLIKEWYRKG